MKEAKAEAAEYMGAWAFNGLQIIATAGEYDDGCGMI